MSALENLAARLNSLLHEQLPGANGFSYVERPTWRHITITAIDEAALMSLGDRLQLGLAEIRAVADVLGGPRWWRRRQIERQIERRPRIWIEVIGPVVPGLPPTM